MSGVYRIDGGRLNPAAEPLVGALTEAQAARYLNIAPRSLWGLRQSGRGPAFVRIGGRSIRYPLRLLNLWLEEQAASQTSTDGGAA